MYVDDAYTDRAVRIYSRACVTHIYPRRPEYMSSPRHCRPLSRFSCPYWFRRAWALGSQEKWQGPRDPKDPAIYARKKQAKGDVPRGL